MASDPIDAPGTNDCLRSRVRFPPKADIARHHWVMWQRVPAMEGPMRITLVLFVVAMIAVIVGLDVAFFRDRFWERLLINVGIVLVFAAFYLRFLQQR
jgi:hypothetical protein